MIFKSIACIALFFIIASCDFTPRLHKQILLAQKYVISHRYENAVNQYEKILEERPPKDIKLKIYYQLGELYYIHLAMFEKAVHYYNLIKENTQDPLWLVKSEEKMGEINYTYLKEYDQSINNYKNLSEFIPKLKRLDFYQYRLASSHMLLNKLEQALEVYSLIQKNGNHEFYVKTLYDVGMIYFQKKDWAKAIVYWNEYIKVEKRKDNLVQTKFLMANAYETMERLKKAYNLYYSILGEYPNNEVILNRLNSIYERRVARKR